METKTKVEVIFIGENKKFKFYKTYYGVYVVRFAKEKASGQLWTSFEDIFTLLYPGMDHKEFFTDAVLDMFNEEKERTGVFPIQTISSL